MDSFDQLQGAFSGQWSRRAPRLTPAQILAGGFALTAATVWGAVEFSGPNPGILPGMLVSSALSTGLLAYLWRRNHSPRASCRRPTDPAPSHRRAVARVADFILGATEDLIVVSDVDGRELWHSPSFTAVLGHSTDELVPDGWAHLVHPDDVAGLRQTQAAVRDSGEPARLELRLRHRDGSWRMLDTKICASRDSAGELRLLTVARDVTERHAAWLALKRSEAALASLVGNLPQGILRKDRRGVVTFANERLAHTLGRPLAELLGRPDTELFPAEEAERVHADDATVMAERRPLEKVVRQTLADGEVTWCHSVTEPLLDAVGEVSGVQVVSWDVTARERAQEALRRAHGESESLLAAISAVLIGVDSRGLIARWNRVAETVFGISAQAAIGRSFFECGLRWDWPRVRQAILDCVVLDRPVEVHDVVCQRAEQGDLSLSLIFSPAPDGPAGGLQFILLATDITQHRILEGQLRQSQKLESIGQLAAGIAHEINTPTQFIGGNLRFVRDSFTAFATFLRPALALAERGQAPAPAELLALRAAAQKADLEYLLGELPKALDESLEGVERVARIVHAMKEFSHPGTAEMVMVDLNRAIESTVTVARNEWKYVAEVGLRPDPALPSVPCHPGDINQVILNLVVNAAHAIAETDRVRRGGKGLIEIATVCDGRWVEIRVRDNGAGIPAGIRPRVFDPFFTTKEVGKGTGQGLFVCHRVIAEKHRGTITFESEVGVGTTFTVRLPLEAPTSREAVA